MPRSINRVFMIGHLGRDAETKFTPNGIACTKFSIALAEKWKDKQSGEWKEKTDWVNVVLWRNEKVAEYLKKGKSVHVEGKIRTRKYEDKEGRTVYVTEVEATEVILLGGNESKGKPDSDGDRVVSMPRSAREHEEPVVAGGISEDDIPW